VDGTGYAGRRLLGALTDLRTSVADLRLPLDVAGADADRALAQRLRDQLDDHLLPRVRQLGAPLLAVVGGSTGAGKSTLVNSLKSESFINAKKKLKMYVENYESRVLSFHIQKVKGYKTASYEIISD